MDVYDTAVCCRPDCISFIQCIVDTVVISSWSGQREAIVVRVERRTAHPLYRKIVKVSKKFTAHDEKNEARKGDTVRIGETRPLSRNKRWRLIEIISRAVQE